MNIRQNILKQLNFAHSKRLITYCQSFSGTSSGLPTYYFIEFLPTTTHQVANLIREYFVSVGAFRCIVEHNINPLNKQSYYTLKARFRD